MHETHMTFSTLQLAEDKQGQLATALGYPDPSDIYLKYNTPIEHPTSGEAAIIITPVCACDQNPFYVKNPEDFLSNAEKAGLKTWDEMVAGGWFPDV